MEWHQSKRTGHERNKKMSSGEKRGKWRRRAKIVRESENEK